MGCLAGFQSPEIPEIPHRITVAWDAWSSDFERQAEGAHATCGCSCSGSRSPTTLDRASISGTKARKMYFCTCKWGMERSKQVLSLPVVSTHLPPPPLPSFGTLTFDSATSLKTTEVAHHPISTRDGDRVEQGIVLGPPIRFVSVNSACSLILSLRSTEVATSSKLCDATHQSPSALASHDSDLDGQVGLIWGLLCRACHSYLPFEFGTFPVTQSPSHAPSVHNELRQVPFRSLPLPSPLPSLAISSRPPSSQASMPSFQNLST